MTMAKEETFVKACAFNTIIETRMDDEKYSPFTARNAQTAPSDNKAIFRVRGPEEKNLG